MDKSLRVGAVVLAVCGVQAAADVILVPVGTDINAAIAAASDGDVLELQAGTHFTSGADLLGKAITLQGVLDPETGVQLSTLTKPENDDSSILRVATQEGAGTVVRDLILLGNFRADTAECLYIYDSSPTVVNCRFESGNGMFGVGGVLVTSASHPTIANCEFLDNEGQVGGLLIDSLSHPEISNCRFQANTANPHAGGLTGLADCNPTITDCAFVGNSGVEGGRPCSGTRTGRSPGAHSPTTWLLQMLPRSTGGEGAFWSGGIPIQSSPTVRFPGTRLRKDSALRFRGSTTATIRRR